MGGVLWRATGEPEWSEEQSSELLLIGTCDGLEASGKQRSGSAPSKAYRAVLPRDVLIRLAIYGFLIALAATFAFLVPSTMHAVGEVPHHLKHGQEHRGWLPVLGACVFLFCLIWVALLLLHIPKRVVREADAIVFEFLLYRHSVPLKDVLELVVLNNGRQFQQLLQRWDVFPHGRTLRCFLGALSRSGGPVCVLLARRFMWSFVFCLEDPVQFLLDNQKPLDVEATYCTRRKAALREGEGVDTKRLADVPKGRLLRVEEQRGRRVRVRIETQSRGAEEVEVTGWMSYITTKGVALLTKERMRDGPAAGTVGASELSRFGTDSTLELGLRTGGAGAGFE